MADKADKDDDDTCDDVNDYVRRVAADGLPPSDRDRSARVEARYASRQAAIKLWAQVLEQLQGYHLTWVMLAWTLLLSCPLLAAPVGAQEPRGLSEPVALPASINAMPVGAIYPTTIRPSADYQRWYRAMERCAHRRGAYKKVRWYVAPGPWPDGKGGYTYGLWTRSRIILSSPGWKDSTLVAHEALHDILYRSGWRPPKNDTSQTARHPSPPFDKCAPSTFPALRPGT